MTHRVHIFTLCLDAADFLKIQLSNFNRINPEIKWSWSIAEGAAMSVLDTAWTKPQAPRLSRDGSTEFINSLRGHPRIRIHQKQSWNGKLEMVNACLADFTEPGIVLQADSDEIWLPEQLEGIIRFFCAYEQVRSARFYCRYFVGNNIIITSTDTYGNRLGEWHRAWRWAEGLRASSHEPPLMIGMFEPCATREQTRECGLVFDHLSWVSEHQVLMKGNFYGYKDALSHWRRLQQNKTWPIRLKKFLPWVGNDTIADVLFK